MTRIRTIVRSTTVPELAPFLGRRVEIRVLDEPAAVWPQGWFEHCVGSITDPSFERPPQPMADALEPVEP